MGTNKGPAEFKGNWPIFLYWCHMYHVPEKQLCVRWDAADTWGGPIPWTPFLLQTKSQNRLILKSTWKKTTKAHSITLIAAPGPVLISSWPLWAWVIGHCCVFYSQTDFTIYKLSTIYSISQVLSFPISKMEIMSTWMLIWEQKEITYIMPLAR